MWKVFLTRHENIFYQHLVHNLFEKYTVGYNIHDLSKEFLNFISISSGPTTCGKPEQPPNSTLIATDFAVGNRIQYSCDEGHLLVGPTQRTCLPTGFYSEFPPVCRCK